MEMKPVTSAAIKAVGYDPIKQELHVEFQSGQTYIHHGVPPHEYHSFVGSGSLGRHYGKHIGGRFRNERKK